MQDWKETTISVIGSNRTLPCVLNMKQVQKRHGDYTRNSYLGWGIQRFPLKIPHGNSREEIQDLHGLCLQSISQIIELL